MAPYMRGSKSKEERGRAMCIGAKICTGKAANEAEAEKICASLPPKEAKPPRAKRGTRSGKCKIDTNALATCVIKSLDGSEVTLATLTTAITSCSGQKVQRPLTRERFIKKCFKENAVTGDIKESQKLRSMCGAAWKEREAAS